MAMLMGVVSKDNPMWIYFLNPPSDFQTPVPSTYFAPNFVFQVCTKKVFLLFVKFHKSALSPKF
jgi:hypothetical protein